EATDSTPGLQTSGSSKIRIAMSAAADVTTEFRFYHFLITADAAGEDTENSAPVAVFSTEVSGLDVSVDGSASTDAEGPISAYAWDFGDVSTGEGVTAEHTYGEAGTYSVTLTVTDAEGETGSVTQSVTVEEAANSAPTAVFSSSVSGLSVSVGGSGSAGAEGASSAYAWDFGDGSTGEGATASHEYAQAGTYEISLTVTDSSGLT